MSYYSGPYDPPSGNTGDVQHYLPGDMVLLVEHPDALNRVDLDQLLRRINTDGGKTKLQEPSYVFSCPPSKKRGPFSLVFTRTTDRDPEPAALVPHLTRVNEMKETGRQEGQPAIQLASPNWLAGGAPPIPWGGPGARPVPVEEADLTKSRHRFKLPRGLKVQRPQRQRGTGVDVAILDTAPSNNMLAQAYERWRNDHALIATLLRPRRKLSVSYDEAGYTPPETYTLADHPYLMPDHGLFAAGIIHSIAPQASLHLIEALNPWGIGNLERLMQVLYQFVDRPSKQPLVVNCSLVLNIPQPDLLRALSGRGQKWAGIEDTLIAQMSTPLEWICDVLKEQGVLIVAAAGNDTTNGKPLQPYYATPATEKGEPAQTRYPAAFDSVLGVGALGPDGQPASYSNHADDPSDQGVATFGGAANAHSALPDQGVLGVYTGAFPDGSVNTNGWAWWAGTSFATPVISGTLAALLSDDPDPDAALAAIRRVTETTEATKIGPAFLVQQG